MLSYQVHLRCYTHVIDKVNIPMIRQGMKEKDIVIEDDVCIGYGTQILSGVHIGKGAVVGAGAMVQKMFLLILLSGSACTFHKKEDLKILFYLLCLKILFQKM